MLVEAPEENSPEALMGPDENASVRGGWGGGSPGGKAEQGVKVAEATPQARCVHRTQRGDRQVESWLSSTVGSGGDFGRMNSENSQRANFPNF